MVGCAAPNCANCSEKGFRLFLFPKNPERRKIWTDNCRRDKWTPSKYSRLCEVHFEENQFELSRADGWKRLKLTAIPTLFNVRGSPSKVTKQRPKRRHSLSKDVHTKSLSKRKKDVEEEMDEEEMEKKDDEMEKKDGEVENDDEIKKDEEVENNTPTDVNVEFSEVSYATCNGTQETWTVDCNVTELVEKINSLQRTVWRKEKEIQRLREACHRTTSSLSSFLSDEQKRMLEFRPEQRTQWSQAGIMQAIEMRSVLGIKGYKYLLETGYPLPSLRTLNRRLQFGFV